MSWRRKYFYNNSSWERYNYACFVLNQLNVRLRNGQEIFAPSKICINRNDRFIFTRYNRPALIRTIGCDYVDLGLMIEKNGLWYVPFTSGEIRSMFTGYYRIRSRKFEKISIKKFKT